MLSDSDGIYRFLLSTWINFNPSTDKNYTHYKVRDEITDPIPNFDGAIVEAWEWINHFIPHITGHVITYSCWN